MKTTLLAPLVEPSQFLQATRESGYRSTATALAELIDNSIQASARKVKVILEHQGTPPGVGLAVVDDGFGIERKDLARALQFGGSTRFGDRSGSGRFGMGLPNASLSQAKRVDLFAWTNVSKVHHAFLDVDSILSKGALGIEQARSVDCPGWLQRHRSQTGAAVVWSRCDRFSLPPSRSFESMLREELGRIFRVHIRNGVEITIGAEKLALIDPIRLLPSPDRLEARLLPPHYLKFRSPVTRQVSTIRVQFALLPVERWASLSAERKREFRIVNRAGVSIMRAGREIAYGWYFLNGKRRENYDDWWRCEVSFEPCLDENFGVTYSKQGIRPSADLMDALSPTIVAQARVLNRAVRDRFAKVAGSITAAEARAQKRHSRLNLEARHPHPTNPKVGVALQKVMRGTRYKLLQEDSDSRAFVRAVGKKTIVKVCLNRQHPFFSEFYLPLTSGNKAMQDRLDCLLLALGRALVSQKQQPESEVLLKFLEAWSDASAVLLGK